MVSGGRMVEMGMDTAYAVISAVSLRKIMYMFIWFKGFKYVCLKVYVHIYVKKTKVAANNPSFEYLSFRTLQ